MAITPYTNATQEAAATVAQEYAPVVVNLKNESANLLSLMPIVRLKQANFNFDVVGSGVTVEAGSETADISNATSNEIIKGHADLVTRQSAFSISHLALDSNAGVEQPAEMRSLFARQLTEHVSGLFGQTTNGMNARAYIGTGAAGDYWGVKQTITVETSTDTFGIDMTSKTLFKSNRINCGGDALTAADFRTAFSAVGKKSNTRPHVIMCSFDDYDYYATLCANKKTLTAMTSSVQTAAGILDLGHDRLTYSGVPLIQDKDCPDGYMLGLNFDHLYLGVLPAAIGSETSERIIIDDPTNTAMIPLVLTKLGTKGLYDTWVVSSTGQVICDLPGSCFCLWNYTAPSAT